MDLSGCSKISSEGIFNLVYNNPSIISLCLNGCSGLDEVKIKLKKIFSKI